MSLTTPRTDYGVFFWSPAGGGHKAAKEAIQELATEKARRNKKVLDTTTYDIDFSKTILDKIWIPGIGGIGTFFTESWNSAQKAGRLSYLESAPKFGWLAELALYPLTYYTTRNMLRGMHQEPAFVVCTQAFGLNAIAQAIFDENQRRGWNTKVHVYITEIPSDDAIHFLPSLKSAASMPKLANIINVHAPKPKTKKGESSEDFWKRTCGNLRVITDTNYPIQKPFLETEALAEKLDADVLELPLHIGSDLERTLIEEGVSSKNKGLCNNALDICLNIKKNDRLAFLMLGSQPTKQSVLNWLDQFVSAKQESLRSKRSFDDRQEYLLLYCGMPNNQETTNQEETLFSIVQEYLSELRKEHVNLENLNILPVSYQPATTVALATARANMTITRSGGATSMAILSFYEKGVLHKGAQHTIIHSEAFQYNTNFLEERRKLRKILSSIPEDFSSSQKDSLTSELSSLLQRLGYTAQTANNIVTSLLTTTIFSSPDKIVDLQEEFESILFRHKELAKIDYKATINKKIEELLKKEKYSSLSRKELKAIAQEKLLLEKGLFLWEKRNAQHLIDNVRARVLNPEGGKKLISSDFF